MCPGIGPLPFGHNRLDHGGFIYAEFERDRPMLGTIEFDQHADDAEPMTLDELRDSARRVLGVDLPVEPPAGDGPHALRRIAGQNTRQADRYRAGNIFLRRRFRPRALRDGRSRSEPGHAGRDEPRLEAGRRGQRLGARGSARHLSQSSGIPSASG